MTRVAALGYNVHVLSKRSLRFCGALLGERRFLLLLFHFQLKLSEFLGLYPINSIIGNYDTRAK